MQLGLGLLPPSGMKLIPGPFLSTSDFQSEVGESFGETGGEFLAKLVWKMLFELLLLEK